MENINNTQESITNPNEAATPTPGEGQGADVVTAQDLAKVVEELKDLRIKNRELREKIEGKEEQEPKASQAEPQSITDAVKQVLAEQNEVNAAEQVKAAKESALSKFKEQNPLYNSSNDPDGSKFKVIEDELNNFNLNNAKSEEDFSSFLGKAAALAGVTPKEESKVVATPTFTPTPGSTPGVIKNESVARLSQEDRAKAQQKGMTEERFAELKAKYPNMV